MIEYTITIAIDKRIPLAVLSPAVGPKFVYPERIADEAPCGNRLFILTWGSTFI